MTTLKEWMDAQWQAKGVKCAKHGTAWLGDDVHNIHARAGTARNYKSKEQKAYEARFAIYNKKLAPVILAQATVEMRRAPVNIYDDKGRYISTKQDGQLPYYTWPKEEVAPIVTTVPRKRVSHKKVAQAAAILERVPADELTAFLAASIASLGDVEMIARQFLRATL